MGGLKGEFNQADYWKPGDPPLTYALMVVGKTEGERRDNLRAYLRGLNIDPDERVVEGASMMTLRCDWCGDERHYSRVIEIPMVDTACGCGRVYLVQAVDDLPGCGGGDA